MPDTNQKCIVTRNVIENDFAIAQFVHSQVGVGEQPSSWIFLHGDEDGDVLNDPQQLELMPLSSVILQRPFIREHLDAPVGGNFTIDQETDRVFDCTEKKTLTFERRVSVPTAAKVRFNVLRWLRIFPSDGLTSVIALGASALAVVHHPAWILVCVYFALLAGVKFIRLNEHFKLGEARPSVIISVKPLLMATEAEFEWKDKAIRFVRITKINRRAFLQQDLVKNTRLPSAVLFNHPKWYDYSPNFDLIALPITYATTDMDQINKTGENLLPVYCQSLDEALAHLPAKLKEGIYEIPLYEAARN